MNISPNNYLPVKGKNTSSDAFEANYSFDDVTFTKEEFLEVYEQGLHLRHWDSMSNRISVFDAVWFLMCKRLLGLGLRLDAIQKVKSYFQNHFSRMLEPYIMEDLENHEIGEPLSEDLQSFIEMYMHFKMINPEEISSKENIFSFWLEKCFHEECEVLFLISPNSNQRVAPFLIMQDKEFSDKLFRHGLITGGYLISLQSLIGAVFSRSKFCPSRFIDSR